MVFWLVLSFGLLAVLIAYPLLLSRLSKKRGVGGSRPRHPFKIPQGIGWFVPTGLPPGLEDEQEILPIPPVSSKKQSKKRHGTSRVKAGRYRRLRRAKKHR